MTFEHRQGLLAIGDVAMTKGNHDGPVPRVTDSEADVVA